MKSKYSFPANNTNSCRSKSSSKNNFFSMQKIFSWFYYFL